LTGRVGVVLGSRSPAALAAWYRWAFGPDVGVIVEARREVAPTALEPHRFIVNVLVDDAAAVEDRLVAGGVVWVRELEPSPCGPIGTVVDPDGNYVQFIEPRADRPGRPGSRDGARPGRGGDGDRVTPGAAGPSRRDGAPSTGAGRRRRPRRRRGR
jgi:hypothetical protein